MTYQEALEYIHSRPRLAHEPGLAVMSGLMQRLGNPQNRLKFVHIAGTNGKGSTAAYLAEIFQAAGFRTGRTVSPYILDFRERFEINGTMISEEDLTLLTEEVKAEADSMEAWEEGTPNEFEIVTAIAFLWFMQEQCDVVVMETGLGGRCDATNIIEAKNTLASCILRIGLDHQELLGDTVDRIAAEKCGILKKGVPVISYPGQPEAAKQVIASMAKEHDCPLMIPQEEDCHLLSDGLLENHIDYGGYDVQLSIMGRQQVYNAAVAIETALTLWRTHHMDISDEAILQGLHSATFPARCEIISREPLTVLDGCHNRDSASALAESLKQAKHQKWIGILGMLADKETTQVLKILSDCFDTIYTVTPNSPRAKDAQDLANAAMPYVPQVSPMSSLQRAIGAAERQRGERQGICICGSLYLAAEARKILAGDKKD